MTAFHEVLFPLDIALGAKGGPERRTDIVTTGSGREERNARWAHSRRRWDAGYGVKSLADLEQIISFFEERRGQLYGFRWRDRLDHASGVAGAAITPLDQELGTGTGTRSAFALIKTYGGAFSPYARPIVKPVDASVRVAVAGVEVPRTTHWTLNPVTGVITFTAGHLPAAGQVVSAGFVFDVPVRFDMERLDVDLLAFGAGDIPHIPVIEIRI